MLRVKGISAGYEDVEVLRGVTLEVRQGEVVSILGANGAGKTTLLRVISGTLKPFRGEVWYGDQRIDTLRPPEIVGMGIVGVPEGRQLFGDMTVMENLEMGALKPRAKARRKESLREVFELFPRLEERKNQLAGTLSGGEQQMLAVGRGLMGVPEVFLLDEPSLGLAPILVQQIVDIIKELNQKGVTILLAEQNLSKALAISSRGYVIENGVVAIEGESDKLLSDPLTKKAYLGMV